MNHTPDNETVTDNDSPLDPQEAAALLDQTVDRLLGGADRVRQLRFHGQSSESGWT